MAIEFALLIVTAYLLGSVPASYLAAKLSKGIDLREYGSGSVGAGNLFRATSSKTLTLIVIIWDLGKGAMMIWLAEKVGMSTIQYVAVGLAVIVGHNWSVFLSFNGGRGVLTSFGVTLLLMPWGILVIIIASPSLLRISSALPVLCATAAQPLVSWLILHQPPAVTLCLLAIFLIVAIRRLTAPKTSDVPFGKEFLLNRLLFDRDIKDGEAWIRRKIEPKAPK